MLANLVELLDSLAKNLVGRGCKHLVGQRHERRIHFLLQVHHEDVLVLQSYVSDAVASVLVLSVLHRLVHVLLAVDEIVLYVLLELLDVVDNHHVGCLSTEPHITHACVVAVAVLRHLHLCVDFVLQHLPLVLITLALQDFVEAVATSLHVSQHVEHLAHHPTAEQRPVVYIAALYELLLNNIVCIRSNLNEIHRNSLAVLDFNDLLVAECEVLAHVVAQCSQCVHALLCLGLLLSRHLLSCLYVLNYYVQVLTSDCCNLFHNSINLNVIKMVC